MCKIRVMTKIIKIKNILYKNKNKYKSALCYAGIKPITCADNNSPCKRKRRKCFVLCMICNWQVFTLCSLFACSGSSLTHQIQVPSRGIKPSQC